MVYTANWGLYATYHLLREPETTIESLNVTHFGGIKLDAKYIIAVFGGTFPENISGLFGLVI